MQKPTDNPSGQPSEVTGVSEESISPVPRQLLSNEVYQKLKDAIVRSELKPGEKVRDIELAQRFGLSRTPVREALARLTEAGLIETKPASYTRVSTLDRDDVTYTLDVLRALDTLALTTAVPLMTSADIEAMREANKVFVRAVSRSDIWAAITADDELHGIPISVTKNPHLSRFVQQLHPTIHRILYRKFSTLFGGKDTKAHHDSLIDLCEQKDAAAAARLSGDHWTRLSGLISGLFDQNQLS